MRPAWRIAWLGVLAALAAAGCQRPCPESLVPLETLVAEHNANARLVPRLWARAKMAVTLASDGGWSFTWGSTSPAAFPNGLLLLGKSGEPFGRQDFVLIGRETAAVEVFRAGSSVRQGVDYFWYRLGDRGAWYARGDRDSSAAAAALPIDPAQLVTLLNVTALPAPGGGLPAVALSMQNVPGDCAYVVAYVDRRPADAGVLLKREVLFRWSDERPHRPYQVNLFDPLGRRVMTARLKDYRRVDVSALDGPPAIAPQMPTDIEIVTNPWPGMRTFVKRVHLVLSEMTAADKWDRSVCDFAPPGGLSPAVPGLGPVADGAAPGRADGGRQQ